MAIDHRHDHLREVRTTLSTLLYPLHWLAASPVWVMQWGHETFATRSHLLEENRRLSRENLRLQAMQQKMTTLEAENMRLRGLLGTSFKVGERVLIAELLAVDLAPYRHQVLIDKGSSSGVYPGQAVLNADAVIGQVIDSNRFTSRVLMITDAAHSLPVLNQRTGLRTIAMGSGNLGQLTLPYLPNNTDIREGDLLVTSGLGRHFPPGYPVARITTVERRPSDPFAKVTARPIAKLDRIMEVLLVWPLSEVQIHTQAELMTTEDRGE